METGDDSSKKISHGSGFGRSNLFSRSPSHITSEKSFTDQFTPRPGGRGGEEGASCDSLRFLQILLRAGYLVEEGVGPNHYGRVVGELSAIEGAVQADGVVEDGVGGILKFLAGSSRRGGKSRRSPG